MTTDYLMPDRPVADRVADLVARMTLAEKVGQLTQGERAGIDADPDQITRLGLGSMLAGGGSLPVPNTPADWADLIDGYQASALATRLRIPLLFGIDAVHGHGYLAGATVFPHNIALGATRSPRLVRECARITALETRSSGPQWVFAPCVGPVRDVRWGRAYESFGETPELVGQMLTAVDGLQGRPSSERFSPNRVLATAKHFAGDGDTSYGTSTLGTVDRGVTVTDWEHFRSVDLAPYLVAVRDHDVASIMVSYSSLRWSDRPGTDPVRMSGHAELLTGVLKERMGFDGIVVSDWASIHDLPGDYATQVRTAVNAGVDVFMEPSTTADFHATLMAEVAAGRVPLARIDDAVGRVLRAKFQLGLFEQPLVDRSGAGLIGSPAHRAVARQAVAESLVLLRNENGVLPLDPGRPLYVAGVNANDLGNQAGGWTMSWQGQSGNGGFPGTTILDGIVAAADRVTYSPDGTAPAGDAELGVVVVGETPYAEFSGDVGVNGRTLHLSEEDRALIARVRSIVGTCIVLVVAGRPLLVTDLLSTVDALVMCWLPGSEGAGVADVLFGRRPFTARLPVSWPRTEEDVRIGGPGHRPLFPYGFGLRAGGPGTQSTVDAPPQT